jgi:hypothetical protein
MGLRKEFKIQMEKSGFLPEEIKEFGSGKTSDGNAMDVNTIALSKPFAEMLLSREEWWRKALSPKSLGGFGMTQDEGFESIRNHYKMTRRRAKSRSVWEFLRIEYKPPDRIKKRSLFDKAVISKSKIVRDMGVYGKKLSLNRSPQLLKRCGRCRGTGTVHNLQNQPQMCLTCGGSGMIRHKFL